MKAFIFRYRDFATRHVRALASVHSPNRLLAPRAGTKTITEVAREATDADALGADGHSAIPTNKTRRASPFLARYAERIASSTTPQNAGTKTKTAVARETDDEDFHVQRQRAFGLATVRAGTSTTTLVASEQSDNDDTFRAASSLPGRKRNFSAGTQTITKVAQEAGDPDALENSYRALR